jgi:hypothetical protein
MSELAELAQSEAVLKALADAVGARLKEVRAELQNTLDDSTGVRSVAATLPCGGEVATITATGGRAEAIVTDPDAFLKWVLTTAPTEVSRRVVTEVRAAFAAGLLNQMTAIGRPEIADRETGVIETVPGVEIRAIRGRSHRLTFTKDGRGRIGAAWRDGSLAAHLPELVDGSET